MRNAVCLGLTFWLLAVGAGAAGASDARFTQSLNAEDRGASGLTRLSSDEVAVIDALVRRDTSARAGSSNSDKAAALFSERLTADERRTAGVPKLSATELPKLNAFVERYQNGSLARTLLAPPTFLSRYAGITPSEKKKEREIHGSYSLSYGFGSGGYSEKTGSMMLTLEDPDRGFSISVGYSESHVKGGSIYRDPSYMYRDPGYIYRDPFYDPLRGPLENSLQPRP